MARKKKQEIQIEETKPLDLQDGQSEAVPNQIDSPVTDKEMAVLTELSDALNEGEQLLTELIAEDIQEKLNHAFAVEEQSEAVPNQVEELEQILDETTPVQIEAEETGFESMREAIESLPEETQVVSDTVVLKKHLIREDKGRRVIVAFKGTTVSRELYEKYK